MVSDFVKFIEIDSGWRHHFYADEMLLMDLKNRLE